jgi:transcriptional regulator with XRE-family HTH domain
MTGEKFKETRLKYSMSLDDCASVLGVSRSTILRYENGTEPNFRFLQCLHALQFISSIKKIGENHDLKLDHKLVVEEVFYGMAMILASPLLNEIIRIKKSDLLLSGPGGVIGLKNICEVNHLEMVVEEEVMVVRINKK